MTDLFFKHTSVAESGDYFQVLFADEEEGGEPYFLVQRQFESPDYGRVYVESHLPLLCGHFRIRKARLGRGCLRLEIMSRPAETAQIRFEADDTQFNQLKRVLAIMFPPSVLTIR